MKGPEKRWGDSVAQSALYGFVEPCGGFAEGELYPLSLAVVLRERRDYFPVRVVEGGPEIVYDISTDKRGLFYDGFVLLGKRGALTGFQICFEDIRERSLFAEQVIQFSNMFRGPINFEIGRISHSKRASK